METDRERERRWRAEEQADFDEALRDANAHRDDCLCWAVRADWSENDPACIRNRATWSKLKC